MSLNIETKKATVEEISAGIANAQTMVIAEYRGISVASMTELRANARKEGVYLRVLKNTLARRAVEGTSFAGLADQMVGPLVLRCIRRCRSRRKSAAPIREKR